jgi:hypothetical protein
MMRKYLLSFVAGMILLVAGCAALDNFFLPNEDGSPSDSMQVVENIEDAAGAVGGPYALPVLAVTNLLTILGGVYTNMRKKQEIVKKDDVYEQTVIIMEAIINAVEDTDEVVLNGEGTTVGDVVKSKVTDRLKEEDIYKVGKALIDVLKGKEQDA